ncbi:MAG: SUMF1/EgtB/PvdO family nonheme iron enzyme, partial [Kiloniellales bacterium]
MVAVVALFLGLFSATHTAVAAAPDTFKDCDTCPEMVVIPAGSFTMGSPASEKGRYNKEGPQHRVSIPRSFALGKYEVTKAEFAAFVHETGRDAQGCLIRDDGKWKDDDSKSWRNPGYTQSDSHPVVCVNWDDAKAYARWLSRKTGKEYRLPSESEWEYAARASTTTARYWGD